MLNPIHIDFLFTINCQINSTFLMMLFSEYRMVRFFIIDLDVSFREAKDTHFSRFVTIICCKYPVILIR